MLRDYGLDDFYLELSTKPEGKAVGTDEEWEEATEALRVVAEADDHELVMDEGGGAFYGPKISVQARDAIGRTWQMSTIQLDLQLPQRFELEYVGADNERQRPIMIHRALFGIHRALLRHPPRALRGRVPHVAGAGAGDGRPRGRPPRGLRRRGGGRTEGRRSCASRCCRAHSDTLGARIRNAKMQKVPYVLVVGDDDVEHRTVGVNERGSDAPERGVALDDFLGRLSADVDAHVRATRGTRQVSVCERTRRGRGLALWRRVHRRGVATQPPSDGEHDCLFERLANEPDEGVARPRPQRAHVRGDERLPVHVGPPDGRAAPARVHPRRPLARRPRR